MISAVKDLVWGLPTVMLLLVSGVYFTKKTAFYKPRAVISTLRDTLLSLKGGSKNGVSPFAAVATALGGTVGVGSIVGVGYAISVGGAGSIFWMWVCSFFGMGLKYAEILVALGKRKRVNGFMLGGAAMRLEELGHKRLASLFCVFCVLASFGTGNLTQVGAMSGFLSDSGAPDMLCAVVCVAVIALAVFGGRGRIAKINSVIVPGASLIYLLACGVILIINHTDIIPVFARIFREAFGFSAIGGGFSGALIARTLREGFVRSMFSNEAGMGSSPLAHSTSETDSPVKQAKWGIFEIFFDTFIVSTLTAICLLSIGQTDAGSMFGLVFGRLGVYAYGVLTAVFAFASVISWCYYAECCISFLFKGSERALIIYRTVFAFAAVPGVLMSDATAWDIADILNACMMAPNLFLLFKCRKEIERIA